MKFLTLVLCAAALVACSPKKAAVAAQGQDLSGLPSSLSEDRVARLVEAAAAARGLRWCVPTPGLGQLDEQTAYPVAGMSDAFKELLDFMKREALFEVQDVQAPGGAPAQTVTFRPAFRKYFSAPEAGALRGTQLTSACVSPIHVTDVLSSRIGNFKGYRWADLKFKYSGDPSEIPTFATNAGFRALAGWSVVGARVPESVAFGDARLELQNGEWVVASLQ